MAKLKLKTDDDLDDEQFYPLVLEWVAEKECWSAGTRMLATESWADFGYFNTVAEADFVYRAAVGLTGEFSEVFVNDNPYCRHIVDGLIVPRRPEEGPEWWKK